MAQLHGLKRCKGTVKASRAVSPQKLVSLVKLKAPDRQTLLLSTALTSTLVLTSFLTASPTNAAGECGPLAATVTCTSTTGVGNPYPDGIEYSPAGDLTLVVDPTVVIDTTSSGFNGVSIPNPGDAVPNGDIVVTAAVGASITADNNGISAITSGAASNITVNNDARIQAGNFGITAEVYNSGNISITNAQNGVIESFDAGINVLNNNGNISVVNSGSITTTITDYYAGAIEARSSGANNNITITNLSTGVIRAQGSIGIYATNVSDGATINITNQGTINSFGYNSGGIVAFAGNGSIVVDNSGSITTANTYVQGIAARTRGGAAELSNSGAIVTSGYASAGMFGGSFEGFDGNVTVINTGSIRTSGAYSYGIEIKSPGAGSTNIFNSGDIQTSGDGANAIDARSRRFPTSSANIFLSNSGQLTSERASGVYAAAANGTIVVVNSGTINGFTHGIVSIADNNTAAVENKGIIQTTGPGGAGISVNSAAGSTISNLSGGLISPNTTTLLAIQAEGAAVGIKNAGTIIGIVDLTDNADVFDNRAGGTFEARLISDFSAGNDVFNNAGTVHTAVDTLVAEATTIINLESFDNSGLVSLIDGQVGDTFSLVGETNFAVISGGRVAVDAFLGAPGSTADVLSISGAVIGASSNGVIVNDSNAGPGSFNPAGIVVIDVDSNNSTAALDTAAKDFFLVGGPIDKGLFSYDLFLDGPNENWVLASTPDATVFELPSIISAAQSLWHASTGVWLDRTADLRSALLGGCRMGMKDAPATCASVSSGAWVKAFGSTAERSPDQQSFGLFNKTFNYDTQYDQDSYGLIGGFDFGRSDSSPHGRGGWLVGVMGGYINSNQAFKNSTTRVDLEGGLVGAYASYLRAGLFVDAQVAANIGEVAFNAGASGLTANDTADFWSIGATVDTGYRMPIGSGAFFEPGATLSYVNTSIDDLSIFAHTANFEDADSLRGRLGIRVGGTIVSGGAKFEPFAGLSGWYEFLGDNNAWIVSNGFLFTANDDTSGFIGEVTAGLNIFSLGDSGVSGFVKGNIQFGENDYQSYGGQLGLRIKW